MLRSLLKSKIHRATVTDADVNYEGSITVDRDLMDAANLVEFEDVHVWDVTNGNRITTYVIEGKRGSGVIMMNGAAAHLVKKGDIVIIGSFADYSEDEIDGFSPLKIHVDENNRVIAG